MRNNLPSDDAISNSNITYEFCWLVFDKYDEIYRAKLDLPEHVVMENVFPNSVKFRNFKRKVTSSTKKKCHDSVEEFYALKNDIGPNCAAIGLSISVFDKI